MAIDKRFERIAKRLRAFELVGGDEARADGDLLDGCETRSGRFLGFYSARGIRRVLDAYGIHATLERLGLGRYDVVLAADTPYRHRLQLLLDGHNDDDHRLIDLIIHVRQLRARQLTDEAAPGNPFEMLMVEWLCMQNPRATFSSRRPRLPGQRFPGLGLAYTMHNVVLLMARRLQKAGVLNFPEHWHLSVLYERSGYRYLSESHRTAVAEVVEGARQLRFAAAAWAAERGLMRRVDPSAPPWSYEPHEMVESVTKRLTRALPGAIGEAKRKRPCGPLLPVTVEVDELRQSLTDDPVEGLAADDLMSGEDRR